MNCADLLTYFMTDAKRLEVKCECEECFMTLHDVALQLSQARESLKWAIKHNTNNQW